MEDLFYQFSLFADEAVGDEEFDMAKIDRLMELFEQEAYFSWSAAEADHQKEADEAEMSMQEAEKHLNSVMEAAMEEYRRTCEEAERMAEEELSGLARAANAARKIGQALGTAATGVVKKYVDSAVGSAMATMKANFATSKVHPK